MKRTVYLSSLLMSIGAALLLPGLAAADPPDFSQSVSVVQPDGVFTVQKSVDIYLDSNPSDPFQGDGELTYLYTISNTAGSLVDINGFVLEVFAPDCLPTSIGFISTGVDPTVPGGSLVDTGVLTRAEWYFANLAPGTTSSQLYLTSACLPSASPDKAFSLAGEFGFDASDLCLAPMIQPAESCELEIDKTCCIPPPPSPGIDQCEGKVLSMKFEYTGQDCSATTNTQEGKVQCSGGPSGDPIDVLITKDEDKIAVDGVIGGTGSFEVGDTFVIDNQEHRDQGHLHELKSETKFTIQGPDDDQSLAIHTSCSKPLSCGDQFGGVRLVEFETTEGGIINCEMAEEPGTMCQPSGSPAGTTCTERPTEIVFEYTGLDCASPLANPQDGKAECSGDPDGVDPVNLTYTGKDPEKFTVSPAAGIEIGDDIRLTATGRDEFHSESKLLISDGTGTLQSLRLHTSCSQPLALGDVFGALTVVEITQKDGQVFSLQDPDEDIFANACEIPAAPPQPHCTSKILDLGLVYTGDDCTISNSQDGKAQCSGDPMAGDPVSITITKDESEISASPSSSISAGDVVIISGSSELKSSTEFDVSGPDGTQSIALHTSCSQPLNLGDRFGPFEVVSLNRKDDGFVSLGGTVEYQYTVTNPNINTATNVFVDDDPFGPIAGPVTIDPISSETFFVTQLIEDDHANTATVTGEVLGAACTEAEDTVVVSVQDPPPGPFDCSDAKPIDSLSMAWQGPIDILVVAYDGNDGDPVLLTQDNVTAGTVVTVSGMGGGPNDQVWEIYAAGADPMVDAPLGTSKFHISCSDDNMNGTEDCGKPQGDGKSDDASLINDWELDGIVGSGAALDCTP